MRLHRSLLFAALLTTRYASAQVSCTSYQQQAQAYRQAAAQNRQQAAALNSNTKDLGGGGPSMSAQYLAAAQAEDNAAAQYDAKYQACIGSQQTTSQVPGTQPSFGTPSGGNQQLQQLGQGLFKLWQMNEQQQEQGRQASDAAAQAAQEQADRQAEAKQAREDATALAFANTQAEFQSQRSQLEADAQRFAGQGGQDEAHPQDSVLANLPDVIEYHGGGEVTYQYNQNSGLPDVIQYPGAQTPSAPSQADEGPIDTRTQDYPQQNVGESSSPAQQPTGSPVDLTGSESLDGATPSRGLSDYTRDLFASAKQVSNVGGEVTRETGRTLANEVIGQIQQGDAVDIKAATRSGIQNTLNDMKTDVIDSGIRSVIASAPDDRRFDEETFYNTFLSPKTTMITPFKAAKNLPAYFQATVGKTWDEFLGTQNQVQDSEHSQR